MNEKDNSKSSDMKEAMTPAEARNILEAEVITVDMRDRIQSAFEVLELSLPINDLLTQVSDDPDFKDENEKVEDVKDLLSNTNDLLKDFSSIDISFPPSFEPLARAEEALLGESNYREKLITARELQSICNQFLLKLSTSDSTYFMSLDPMQQRIQELREAYSQIRTVAKGYYNKLMNSSMDWVRAGMSEYDNKAKKHPKTSGLTSTRLILQGEATREILAELSDSSEKNSPDYNELAQKSALAFLQQCYIFFQESAHASMLYDSKFKDVKRYIDKSIEGEEVTYLLPGHLEGADGKEALVTSTYTLVAIMIRFMRSMKLVENDIKN